MADAVHNVAHASLLVLGLARDDFSLIGRGLADRLHQDSRAAPLPPLDGAGEQGARPGRRGGHDLGAGPSVLFWCHWQQTGTVVETLNAAAEDCHVRRVNFAPGGADVREL